MCCEEIKADSELVAHHLEYRSGAEMWDYPLSSLVAMCKPCHQRLEALVKWVRRNSDSLYLIWIMERMVGASRAVAETADPDQISGFIEMLGEIEKTGKFTNYEPSIRKSVHSDS